MENVTRLFFLRCSPSQGVKRRWCEKKSKRVREREREREGGREGGRERERERKRVFGIIPQPPSLSSLSVPKVVSCVFVQWKALQDYFFSVALPHEV